MIPASSLVLTRDGLVTLRNLEGITTLWTGTKWAKATISSASEIDVATIQLENGSRFLCPLDFPLCIANEEQYYWKIPM